MSDEFDYLQSKFDALLERDAEAIARGFERLLEDADESLLASIVAERVDNEAGDASQGIGWIGWIDLGRLSIWTEVDNEGFRTCGIDPTDRVEARARVLDQYVPSFED